MTTYSPFELEPIFIDFKNESYNLGLDIQANQNDTLTLNFICRNNGIEEDMSKYKVELRVHNNNANVDYIQTQNENVTLGKDGSVKIVCQSLKGNKLTAYSGQLNGVLRIFNTENKQKATRIITMRIIADPLETDRANICESTITKLEDLDWILNEAYNIEDEFKKAIKEAIKQKDALIKTTNEAKVINTTLAGNITTGTELNSNLVNSNKLAETNQKELDTRNTAANKNIETLTNKNITANETIINISNKIEKGTKLDKDLEEKTITGTTLKSDLDTNIETGTQLKTDLTELIPQANKSKSDLDTSKINADLSNTTLTETTNNAEKKKREVVAECKVADEKIKQMNEFGDVSEISKDINLMKTEIITARDNEIDLNTRLERDKSNILKTIGQVDITKNGDIASQLKDCAKNIDNKRTTTVKDVTGAINELNSSMFKKTASVISVTVDILTLPLGQYCLEGTVSVNNNFPYTLEWTHATIEVIGTFQGVDTRGYRVIRVSDVYGNIYENSQLWESNNWSGWKQLATTESTEITLLNGWGKDHGELKITKTGSICYVNFQGTVGVTALGTIIFNIPVGFRTRYQQVFYIPQRNGKPFYGVAINPDGNVSTTGITVIPVQGEKTDFYMVWRVD
ncbi:hypothetical protein ACTFJW_16940 [Clostridium cagae]|uniref:hypothetical protein n=1 Tax=Clostridium cagae TaxID=2080751 RepID=UPI003F7672DE